MTLCPGVSLHSELNRTGYVLMNVHCRFQYISTTRAFMYNLTRHHIVKSCLIVQNGSGWISQPKEAVDFIENILKIPEEDCG